jgi:hypothetical protein
MSNETAYVQQIMDAAKRDKPELVRILLREYGDRKQREERFRSPTGGLRVRT